MDASIPSTFRCVLLSFFPVFSSTPSFENFVTLVTGWLLCRERRSICQVQRCGSGPARKKNFTVFYRFFSRATWSVDTLGLAIFQLVLTFLGDQVFAVVDDTLNRRGGPHFWGAGMHHDALSSTYGRGTKASRVVRFAFGHNWVVLAVCVPCPWNPSRYFAIPVLWRLHRSKKSCPESEYAKRTEMARELIGILHSWLPEGKKLKVLADGEYACATVLQSLPEGVHFTGPILMNAAINNFPPEKRSGRGRPRKKGARLPSPLELSQDDSTPWRKVKPTLYGKPVEVMVKVTVCLWYRVTHTRSVRVVVTRDPSGRIEDRAYFTTDLGSRVEDILCEYSMRWSLEVTFRDVKQNLGLGDPQNGWWRSPRKERGRRKKPGPQPKGKRGMLAVTRTVPLIFALYGLVIVWYFQHGNWARDVSAVRISCPWYRHKSEVSFADMHRSLRRELKRSRINGDPLLASLDENSRAALLEQLALD